MFGTYIGQSTNIFQQNTFFICLDNQGFPGALLMDLSKAFDTVNHELLIAKLHAYGFFVEALEVLLS